MCSGEHGSEVVTAPDYERFKDAHLGPNIHKELNWKPDPTPEKDGADAVKTNHDNGYTAFVIKRALGAQINQNQRELRSKVLILSTGSECAMALSPAEIQKVQNAYPKLEFRVFDTVNAARCYNEFIRNGIPATVFIHPTC